MKHTFDCGITALSKNGVGDLFLAQMITGIRQHEFPGIKNLPPNFLVHCDDFILFDPELKDKWRQAVNAMLRSGYDMIEYRDPCEFFVVVRFRWRRPI